MRKTLLTALLMMIISLATFAAKEDLYVLHADFEEGTSLPVGWTMESVFGDQDWIIESGEDLAYPQGAASGKGRIALRNNTSQTQRFVTRLITPVMDLSKLTAQPMLVFSHAQQQRLGDVDVLRIYYRTAPNSRWVQIAEYNQKIVKWQSDTVMLDAYNTATYQIAFEGTDQFGRGIVLDDIIVRPDVTCEDARDIHARSLSGTDAVIEWGGSLDTDSFEVVVSKKLYSSVEEVDWEDAAIIYHDFVYDFTVTLKDLDINTPYYIYIKAYCPTLEGRWVGGQIKTLNKVQLPFIEHFDAPYNKDNPSQTPNWTYGTSMREDDGVTMKALPYLTNYRTESMWKNYSSNATPALEFAAAINATVLPAGEYAYAASPEIDIDRIQDAYVDFWATDYLYNPGYDDKPYAAGIIVGVMENPADYSTFVPVDTCYAINQYKFDFFRVKFDKYTGKGKHIAFASDFKDEITLFWVDEVTVGSLKEVARPVDIKVKEFTPTSAVVEPTLVNGTAWNLIVSDIKTEEVDKLVPANILAKFENITGKEQLVNLENMEGKWVRFYVQAVNGEEKSEWSYAQKYMMPNSIASTALPKTWNFETKGTYSYTEIWDYTSQTSSTAGYLADGIISHVFHYADGYVNGSAETTAHGGSYSYHLNKRNSFSPYAVFPQLDSVQNKLFTFFYKDAMGSSSGSKPYFQVGVMTDPQDTATFELVRAYNDAQDGVWKKGEVDFFGYKGEGRYIAIRLVDGPNTISSKTAYGSIDDVTISAFDDCIKPLNVEAIAQDSAITIKWDANGMTKWAVAISENWEDQSKYMRDTVTTNQFTIDKLMPHTVYTYQITTLVGAKKSESDVFTIKTECSPFELIPFKEGFEDAPTNTSLPEIPNCWTIPQVKYYTSSSYGSSTSYYPHAYSSTTSAHSGNVYLQLGYSSLKDSMYAALPALEMPVNQLQLSFYIRGGATGYSNDTLYVGVMTDPNDIATFDTIYTFTVSGQAYNEQIVNLSSYAGQGKHIAIYKPVTSHYYFIDDVEVKELPECEKVFNISAKDFRANGATFSWFKKDASKWQFVVATKKDLSAKQIGDHDKSIVMDSIIEVNPFKLAADTIEDNVQYYAYIRAVCEGDNYGEWSAPFGFKTICEARDIDHFAANGDKAEKFSGSDDGCWKFGDRVGSGTHNILNGHIQLINSSANTDGAYAIAPQLTIDSMQYMQITFDAWCAPSTSYNMCEVTVGIITNPEDLSTFVPLDVVKGEWDADANDHQAYTVRFNKYEGDYNEDYGNFVMFISESGDKSNKIEFTNIYFDSISAYPEPLSIVADSIGSYGMKIRWENTKADSYEYRYTDKLANIDKVEALSASVAEAELSDLVMLKTYYVQVRAKYGDNWSKWSNWRKFMTECPAARPIPFSENFDNGGIASASANTKNPPQCWTTFGSDGTEGADCYSPAVYNTAKKDGVGGLVLRGTKTTAFYAVLPRLDADLSNAILTFDYKHQATNYADSLWIGVASNVENLDSLLNTVVWCDSILEKPANTNWNEYQRKMSEATHGEQYIVLKSKINYTSNSTSYGIYIDNMSVEPEATCKKPEAPVAVDRALNALGFSWTDTIASQWDVVALEKGDAPDENTVPAATVDTTYASISGLDKATEYDLYVRANCGGGDVSFWVGPVTMKTLNVAKYPYFTNFEKPTETTAAGNATYKVDAGWITGHAKGTGTTYSAYPYVKTNTATTNFSYGNGEATAANALMFAGQTSADSMYVILPVMYDSTAMAEVDLDTVQIRFQARQMTSGLGTKKNQIPFKNPSVTNVTGDPAAQWQEATRKRAIMVGVVSNPMDISTFHMLDSFVLAPVLSAKDTFLTTEDPRDNMWWEEISIPLAGAKGKYIAMLYYGTSSNYFYIDNLYVEKAVGLYAPNNIKGVTASPSSITVTWTNRFNAPKIDIGYVAAGGALSELTIVTTDKDTFEIVGLESNKQYDVYVRANDGNGHVTNWSAGAPLTTAYVVEQAEAYWDFSKTDTYIMPTTGKYAPLGWKFGSKYSTSTSYNPQLQFNAANAGGTALNGNVYSRNEKVRNASLYIQSFVSSSNNSDGAYAIMPLVKGNLDDKELHFWARLCTHTYSTGAIGNATYATAAYPRSIKVGYVSDPDNINTFVLLADIELPAFASTSGNISGDASGKKYWNEIAVPLKGIGEGKYIAFLSEYGKTNALYIDQVKVQDAGSSCYMPNRVRLDSLGAHAAKFSWELGEGEWAVLLSTTKNTAQVIRDTVTSRVYLNDTLLANTPYIFKVKKICDENVESKEVSVEFTTNCDPYDKEKSTWSFSDRLTDMVIGTTTNKIPECWISGLGNGTTATYFPQAIPNTGSIIYAKDASLSTSDRSLQFRTTASAYNAYAVLPPMDIDREKTVLHFYGRAAYFNKTFNSSNMTFLNSVNNGYLRKLVVGVMDDPTDLESFVAVDTITYDHVWPVLKESNLTQDSLNANNYYWQEYTLELKNYMGGEYIAILAPKPEANSYFFIDDMSIIDAETCTEISSIKTSNITKSSAKMEWSIPKGVENFYVEVSLDEEFKDEEKVVYADTIEALSLELTKLNPGTQYFVRIKHICSEQKQSEFAESSFTTLYTIRFTEKFEAERTIPANWALYNYVDMKPTNTNSWERKSGKDDDNMYGAYMSSYIMGSWKRWMATPQIDLSDVAAADSIALSFDLATTNKNLAQEDSVFFLVMISTDGGATWPEENRTVWGTTPECDYPLSAISNAKKGTRWFINMNKYNGQVIRIMFGTDVTKLQGSTGYILLDNVQLNHYTASEYAQTVCEWTEYEDANFSIDANALKVGQTTKYEKFSQTEKAGEKDKYAHLDLTVTPMAQSSLEESLCEGEKYMLNDFEIAEPQTGVYRRKLQGLHSCDSVVTLNLNVLSKQYAIVEKTICQGSFYEFNGVKYYTNTIKSDTLYGQASNGCDSIVALYLTVAPILAGDTDVVFLCPDSTYFFSEKYPALKDSGTYVDTIQTALGCDSIIRVTINNVPKEQTFSFIRAAICQGEVYNEGVFAGLSIPGDYPSVQQSVYGCDSVSTLHLIVAIPDPATQSFMIYDTIAINQLPYVLNGQELIPDSTAQGIYSRSITLSCGEATVVINVGEAEEEGIVNTFVNTLAIMPNPAAVGQSVRVLGNFSNADVEVISATGAAIYKAQHLNDPIAIPGMPAAGVYLVRLIENGKVHQAKLIVQ